ncbi:hypothetical protein [Embleya scabrispora]|uniref:hypothetical protein n=1 Tax=Embleya scabrispora TaxID=159449 RepID=UPI0003A826FF|nr:hypothetical protein [Embleya scabrispora]MYS79568.1 hypothetical protein [Streptomyces sp. SID5474]
MTERDARDESMEDLLRAALASRADSVTLGSLRPPGPPTSGNDHRSRLGRIGVPLAVLAAAAAAFGGVSLIGAPKHTAGAPADRPMSVSALPTREHTAVSEAPPLAATSPSAPGTTAPASVPASEPPPESTPSTTPPSRPSTQSLPTGTRTASKTFGAQAIKVTVPSGWRDQPGAPLSDGTIPSRCFSAPVTGEVKYPCDLDSARILINRVGDPDVWSYAKSLDVSAYNYATQPMCAKDGHLVLLESTETITPKVVTRDKRTVGGHGAEYRVISVTCKGGQDFKVRTWSMPDLGIEIFATSADAKADTAIDRVVASVDLSGFKPRTTD